MFDSLFGSEPSVAKFVIAFVVVIALIALAAWLVRRFGASRLGNGATRGRQPRLAVIDAASVDGRRRLVLIRRDNIEHLLMIGGPTDIVVEPNIVRATTRDSTRDSVRLATPDTTGRAQPADIGTSWPLQPAVEPALPATPARHLRATFGEETHWNANGAPQDSAHDDLPAHEPARARTDMDIPAGKDSGRGSSLPTDLSARPAPPAEPSFGRHAAPEPPAAPPVEPVRRHASERAPEPDFDSRRTDRNLAEMASRLEAALRRPPPASEGRPPVTDALAFAPKPAAAKPAAAPVTAKPNVVRPDMPRPDMPRQNAPAPHVADVKPPAAEVRAPHAKVTELKAAETKAPARAPEVKPTPASSAPERMQSEARTADAKPSVPTPPASREQELKGQELKGQEPKGPSKTAASPEPASGAQAPQPTPKSIYDNLEQEMASLLGRTANK
jgi:hypothetical protein